MTPDSFYDGNKNINASFFKKKLKFLKNSDIIDVGAESSRPYSSPISIKDEIKRLSLFIKIKASIDNILSIDSYKYDVIKYALDNGFHIINDITGGGRDNSNIKLAAEYGVPIIIMHMQGNPQNMQVNSKYDNLIDNIINFFEVKINIMKNEYNLTDDQIIIDPGIGFGKSKNDNYMIIDCLDRFKSLGFPIVIGISRKSFLSIDDDTPNDRMESTLIAQSIAAYNGANCIRTHDVNEAYDSLRIIDRFKKEL